MIDRYYEYHMKDDDNIVYNIPDSDIPDSDIVEMKNLEQSFNNLIFDEYVKEIAYFIYNYSVEEYLDTDNKMVNDICNMVTSYRQNKIEKRYEWTVDFENILLKSSILEINEKIEVDDSHLCIVFVCDNIGEIFEWSKFGFVIKR